MPLYSQPLLSLIEDDNTQVLLCAHYLRLGPTARRTRFLVPLRDAGVKKIAQSSRPTALYGIHVDGACRGVIEIFQISHQVAEVGLSVEEPYQRRGFGRQLLEAGLEDARQRDIRSLIFHIDPQNVSMRHLLTRAGASFYLNGDQGTQATIALHAQGRQAVAA